MASGSGVRSGKDQEEEVVVKTEVEEEEKDEEKDETATDTIAGDPDWDPATGTPSSQFSG